MSAILGKVKSALRQEVAYTRRLAAAKRSFASLPRVSVVIFDGESNPIIDQVVDGLTRSVLYTRGELVHLHPSILWRVPWFLIRFGRMSLAYPAAVISRQAPDVVITFIDNDGVFHELANRLPGRRFVAVQNGWRFPDYAYALKEFYAYRSEMYCFGDNDIEQYATHGTTFASIRPIGSIRNSLWLLTTAKADEPPVREPIDVCVVSQFRYPEPIDLPVWKDIDLFIRQVAVYHAMRPHLRVAVAMFYSEGIPKEEDLLRREVEYFRKHLGPDVALLPNNAEKTNTYWHTQHSAVNISTCSTASLEAAARGKRTLVHSPVGLPEFSEASRPPWRLVAAPQSQFDESLDVVVRLSDEEFVDAHAGEIEYFMSDVDPASCLSIMDDVMGLREARLEM